MITLHILFLSFFVWRSCHFESRSLPLMNEDEMSLCSEHKKSETICPSHAFPSD